MTGVLALLAVSAAGAVAQTAAESSERLFLADRAPAGQQGASGPPCGQLSLYALTEPGQAPETAGKAYTSRSSVAVGCPTLFRTQSPGAFNLTQDSTAHLFFGCEEPTVMHQPLNNLRVWLTRNGEDVSEGQASLDTVCRPGSPLEAEVAIGPPEDASFGANDTIGLNLTAFGSPNAVVDNIHVLVGGERASSLLLPGLSEAYEIETVGQAEPVDETPENDTELEPQRTSPEENGTPGPGGLGLLAGLAAAAWVRRYR